MKILYITPKINNEGGAARVMAVKANYLCDKLGYTIHIATQNEGNTNPFYDYHPSIHLHDITLNGTGISFLYQYKKQIENLIKTIDPELVVLSDFGWKAFFFPFIIKTTKPVLFEVHASKYNEPIEFNPNAINRIAHQLKYAFRNYSIKKFDKFIVLSKQALAEWDPSPKGIVIPNPLWLSNPPIASLEAQKVIVAARYSYEKGIDRLLHIWQQVQEKYPNWTLEIYGKTKEALPLEALAQKLNLSTSVRFLPPAKNIEEQYKEASIYAMTSRSEAFAMVVLEAMSCGLPVVAFDCPVGPRSLIQDKVNGFLIEDGDTNAFAHQLMALMESKSLRKEIGEEAQKIKENYALEMVMKQWDDLLCQYKKEA
ncbi:MAG: hypothetical protein RL427_571 [Bacteroidota bacterium]|jgi:glycosyltransferase involved in cell wall biosynthesis